MSIRITLDGKVIVSVPMRISFERAKEFMYLKQNWILRHLRTMETKTQISLSKIAWGSEAEAHFLQLVLHYWQYFEKDNLSFPTIRFRKMKSSWGICRKVRGIITLNKALIHVPKECQAYVVVHEMSHLIEANHSKAFYRVMARIMPEYKEYEERLKQYAIQD